MNLYKRINLEGSTIIFEFTDEFKNTDIVTANFWAKYEDIDLSNLDESILNIPMLLNIAPAVWAMNIDVKIPSIDKDLSDSLENIKPAFKAMYPTLSWSGNIWADKVVKNSQSTNGQAAIFFSGGLDSVFSTISHLAEQPLLVTVRGSDVSLTDDIGWNLVKRQSTLFSKMYGLTARNIETNFFDFLNQAMLSNIDKNITGWWGGVQHGMGFAGLMAPLSSAYALSRAYIASSHSTGFIAPWGSDPRIDNHIQYNSLKFYHDGFELTRHGKIRELIRISKINRISLPNLRVCYSNKKNAAENCCICEKCSRTMTGLWVEAENPLNFGFPTPADEYIMNVKEKFSRYEYVFNENTLFHWQDIQKHIRSRQDYVNADIPIGVVDLLEWIRKFDFSSYKAVCDRRKITFDRKMRNYQRALSVLKTIPSLYRFLKFARGHLR